MRSETIMCRPRVPVAAAEQQTKSEDVALQRESEVNALKRVNEELGSSCSSLKQSRCA